MQNSCSYDKLKEEISKGYIKQFGNNKDGFQCLLCTCYISGQAQAESHAVGLPHDKKVKSLKTITSEENTNGNGINPFIITPSENEFYCKDCDLCVSGEIPMRQHLRGKLHLKKVNFILSSSSSSSPMEVAEENTNEIGKGPFIAKYENEIYCKYCDLYVTGEIPMRQHEQGKAHLRRVGPRLSSSSIPQATLPKNVPEVPPRRSLPSNLSNMYFCDICSIQMNAESQMEQHLIGKSHLRKEHLQRNTVSTSLNTEVPSVLRRLSCPIPSPRHLSSLTEPQASIRLSLQNGSPTNASTSLQSATTNGIHIPKVDKAIPTLSPASQSTTNAPPIIDAHEPIPELC